MEEQLAKMVKELEELRSKSQRLTTEHEELRCQVEELMEEQQRLLKENRRLKGLMPPRPSVGPLHPCLLAQNGAALLCPSSLYC